MKLYFERHDGQAVTCDDFAQAIADANPGSALATHLAQFKRWYGQAGTPQLVAQGRHDALSRTYTLEFTQRCPATPGQPDKLPFVIPVALGLLDAGGHELPLQLEGEAAPAGTRRVLVLTEATQRFVFTGVDAAPVPSLLRGFSAPVHLDDGLDEAAHLHLLRHDADPFNRWEAGQTLMQLQALAAIRDGAPARLDDATVAALREVLRDPATDAGLKELILTLPSEANIADRLAEIDPQRVHAVHEALRTQLASALREDWAAAFEAHQVRGAYTADAASAGRRALANLALAMLCLDAVRHGNAPVWPGRAYQRVKDATNMTERLGALRALVDAHAPLADPALAWFHARFRDEPLVVDMWFGLQASAPERDGTVFARARALLRHPDFSLANPNRARSLVMALIRNNPAAFHRADAAGYVFWAEHVLALDAMNPQLGARVARGLERWRQLAEPYRSAAREAIARVAAKPDLSPDVREIVDRALAG
jgi:aminopeptidase N